MKVYKALIGIMLAGNIAFPGCVQAADKTIKLSLGEAVSMARENNRTIKAARSRVAQADAKIVQTRQSYLPKVTLTETAVVTNDPGAALVFKLQQNIITQSDFIPDKLNNADIINDFNTSLLVMQPVYNPDASIGRTMALTAKKAQEHMAARTTETVELQVSKLYYSLILARKNIEAVEQSIITMKNHSSEADKAYRVGLLTKSDKLSTDVRLAELMEQKLMLHDAIKNATDALKVMLNLDANLTIIPTGDLVVDKRLPVADEKNTPDGRSDLQALQTYREIAGYQESMAQAAKLPRVNAFFQTNLHSSDIFSGGSSWALGMTMQWNIYDGNATTGRIQEAKAQQLEAMYNHEEAKSQSLVEIKKAQRELKTAKARIAVAQESLEEARISLDYIGTQFKTGMAMTFELLMREGAYTYAKLRLNQAKYDYCIARSELAYYSAR
ncbi:MAG: TolC family protein [Chlorobiaceae bacterium]|jgi:outer membrane protein|nr:TolC family protein [Chlorobiaceae bacterium]NTW62858.1 TolC family protein [Chlorobiaceae bacterium]